MLNTNTFWNELDLFSDEILSHVTELEDTTLVPDVYSLMKNDRWFRVNVPGMSQVAFFKHKEWLLGGDTAEIASFLKTDLEWSVLGYKTIKHSSNLESNLHIHAQVTAWRFASVYAHAYKNHTSKDEFEKDKDIFNRIIKTTMVFTYHYVIRDFCQTELGFDPIKKEKKMKINKRNKRR